MLVNETLHFQYRHRIYSSNREAALFRIVATIENDIWTDIVIDGSLKIEHNTQWRVKHSNITRFGLYIDHVSFSGQLYKMLRTNDPYTVVESIQLSPIFDTLLCTVIYVESKYLF